MKKTSFVFKRTALGLSILAIILIAGCGVKSDLDKPEGDTYPRNYPTY